MNTLSKLKGLNHKYKAYKNCPAEVTIQRIKSIVKDRLNLDLLERTFIERNSLFYSCRLVINNEWISALNERKLFSGKCSW